LQYNYRVSWTAVIILVLAYLFGSIPAGAWIARTYGINIQKVGSGNTGATNILRTLGWGPALIVALFDILKGGIAVLIARLFGIEGLMLGLVALAAILGHNYSLFLLFKGGKGVSTSLGTVLFLDPLVGLGTLLIGISTIALTRYVSAGSMVGGITGFVLALLLKRPAWEVFIFILIGALIFWTHRENIKRLQAGNERRFGEKVT
jgi:glycerol-3-phosphate acyltransferase PlsY